MRGTPCVAALTNAKTMATGVAEGMGPGMRRGTRDFGAYQAQSGLQYHLRLHARRIQPNELPGIDLPVVNRVQRESRRDDDRTELLPADDRRAHVGPQRQNAPLERNPSGTETNTIPVVPAGISKRPSESVTTASRWFETITPDTPCSEASGFPFAFASAYTTPRSVGSCATARGAASMLDAASSVSLTSAEQAIRCKAISSFEAGGPTTSRDQAAGRCRTRERSARRRRRTARRGRNRSACSPSIRVS